METNSGSPQCPPNGFESGTRYDFSRIGKAQRTPQGFLKFDARPTRAGVLKYQLSDGTIRRELRPPEEVFRPDSLETLAGAPLTDLHVLEVTPSNVASVQKGRLSESISHDGTFVKTSVIVQDSGLIEKIDRGDRKELSAGYRCQLDFQSGEFNGAQYDAIQRNIVYNHVAIGPAGWGRAGSDVSLRLDGDAAVSFDNVSSLIQPHCKDNFTPATKESVGMAKILKIDGVEYTAEADDALFQAFARHSQRRDQLEKDLGEQIGAVEKKLEETQKLFDSTTAEYQGKSDSYDKQIAGLQADLAKANDPARLDALASARANLFGQAHSVLGSNEKLDGLSERAIKEKVLVRLDPEIKLDGQADSYVNGAFEIQMRTHSKKRADGVPGSRSASIPQPPTGESNPDSDRYDAAKAYREMVERDRSAWQQTKN